MAMLKDKKIVLGVTGGIAAYKAVEVASRLRKAGAEVHVIMTKGATNFVTAEDDSYLNYMNDVRELYLTIFGIEH